jgi:hypothetical protein
VRLRRYGCELYGGSYYTNRDDECVVRTHAHTHTRATAQTSTPTDTRAQAHIYACVRAPTQGPHGQYTVSIVYFISFIVRSEYVACVRVRAGVCARAYRCMGAADVLA